MLNGSVQSRTAKQTRLPLSQILRPIPPVLDTRKIDSMVSTLSGETPTYMPTPAPESIIPGHLPPVDVLHYRSPISGKDFYFAFGGCHRLQAYDRAKAEEIDCKVMRVTKDMLKVYLGASVDTIINES